MNIKEYAKKEGFKTLTCNHHPEDDKIVEILGGGIVNTIRIERVKWAIYKGNHSYRWITHYHNLGILTMTFEYLS